MSDYRQQRDVKIRGISLILTQILLVIILTNVEYLFLDLKICWPTVSIEYKVHLNNIDFSDIILSVTLTIYKKSQRTRIEPQKCNDKNGRLFCTCLAWYQCSCFLTTRCLRQSSTEQRDSHNSVSIRILTSCRYFVSLAFNITVTGNSKQIIIKIF